MLVVVYAASDSPIDGDAYQHEAGQVEAEGPREHHQAAHEVASQPLHCAGPRDLQRHHQECHLKQLEVINYF